MKQFPIQTLSFLNQTYDVNIPQNRLKETILMNGRIIEFV